MTHSNTFGLPKSQFFIDCCKQVSRSKTAEKVRWKMLKTCAVISVLPWNNVEQTISLVKSHESNGLQPTSDGPTKTMILYDDFGKLQSSFTGMTPVVGVPVTRKFLRHDRLRISLIVLIVFVFS